MSNELPPPEPGNTSVRLGKAFLRPYKDEKGHYELCRPTVTVINEGDKITTQAHGDPIPLAIYREKRHGDKQPTAKDLAAGGPPPEIKTSDTTGRPMTLVLVHWIGK